MTFIYYQYVLYCVQTSKCEVNSVIRNSLFKTMKKWQGLPVFYIKQKEGERELDGGETERERESVWVRGRGLQQEKDSIGNKTDC